MAAKYLRSKKIIVDNTGEYWSISEIEEAIRDGTLDPETLEEKFPELYNENYFLYRVFILFYS